MPDSLVASHPGIAPLLTDRPQRARLLEAMVQAVAEKGYEAATVADAVRLARVSRGTFYELFESKEACLLAAYRLGYEVLESRIDVAIRPARDWREELRLGIRAYLQALEQDPLFARVYLVEAEVVWEEREAVLHRFAHRYAATFARSGRPAPPLEALYLLASGVHALACARVRTGGRVRDLEDILVGCAVRLVGKEETWI
ncbi:MAG: TetR/AcrR family transcriptional regulator [Solirubrobacterales bacterium]|nr:TetR/AcrR family transcriptional regulator [Solirubrobacterales bacterium]MBV9714417.1 TetR/AcrR family transcriptional regulator [Solirubrobacterales bacterium]